ncbi:hypothetical protein F5Y15DRAFT_337662 [Xylariaceae sp. FL0016]|nr:hypothetical protein F5Y15DRAFT_337662 [Xylariaceae sp. FL0016]
MVHRIPSAKLTLTYPLYGCGFADPNHLVVAGGGGPGRNGVGNKITLLDTSDPAQVAEVTELELSPNEDNVTSLAIGPRKDKNLTVFAGVNSSPEDIKKGKNQHFRVLGLSQLGQAAKKGGEKSTKFSDLARDALFVHKDADTYQRLLRLSHPYQGLSQLGAVATGLSKEPQIALFDVPSSGNPRWKARGRLDIPTEAMDLDVIQTGKETYQLAYCDENEVYTVEVSKEGISDPKCIYSMPNEDGSKASFKSLRYLTPGFLITTVNLPKSGGVALNGLRMPDQARKQENARLTIQAKLPNTVSKATGLAVRNLTPVVAPVDKQTETQFVVAVAGNDSSISLYTVDHKSAAGSDLLADLAPFQVIKSAHPSNITGLSFSTFTPPEGSPKTPQELSVKLASVAVGFTTVVHSIPLKKHMDKSNPTRKGGPPKPSRYVVALKSKGESPATVITLFLLVLGLLLLIGQTFLEAKGITEPVLGVNRILPASWTVPLRKVPLAGEQQKTITDLLSETRSHHSQQLIVKHQDTKAVGQDGVPHLHVGIHDEEIHGPGTSWEDLKSEEQDMWRQRLKKSGHWAEDMGEAIFKGVLFGEIGGAIGNIIGEAL